MVAKVLNGSGALTDTSAGSIGYSGTDPGRQHEVLLKTAGNVTGGGGYSHNFQISMQYARYEVWMTWGPGMSFYFWPKGISLVLKVLHHNAGDFIRVDSHSISDGQSPSLITKQGSYPGAAHLVLDTGTNGMIGGVLQAQYGYVHAVASVRVSSVPANPDANHLFRWGCYTGETGLHSSLVWGWRA